MPRPVRADVQDEYAYWCAAPKRLKISMGLPLTDLEFARVKEVDPRTLRRWKEKPEFQQKVREKREEISNVRPNATVTPREAATPVTTADDPAFDPDLPVDEQRYLQVKDTLVQMAMDGNQTAIDLYLKHYGKSFISDEQDSFSEYERMSDEELVYSVLSRLGVDRVSSWLAESVDA